MSGLVPNLSNLSLACDLPSSSSDDFDAHRHTLSPNPTARMMMKPAVQTLEQLKQFTTGSHSRDRRYTPIDVDTIDKSDAYESSLAAFKTRRSEAAISMVIKTTTDDDVVARAAVKLGEGVAQRLLGYHPQATFDVDVVTSQKTNVCSVTVTNNGVRLFSEAMCSHRALNYQLQRVLLKRASVEARMLFLRIPRARFYDVEVEMPGGILVSEREHF